MASRSCIWDDPPSRNEGLCRETLRKGLWMQPRRSFVPSAGRPRNFRNTVGLPRRWGQECSGCRWGLTLLAVHFPHKGRMKGSKLRAEDKGSRAAAHDRRLSLAQMRPRDALGRAQPGSWFWRTPKALTLRAPRLFLHVLVFWDGVQGPGCGRGGVEGVMGKGLGCLRGDGRHKGKGRRWGWGDSGKKTLGKRLGVGR